MMALLRPGHQWDGFGDYYESELQRSRSQVANPLEEAIVRQVVDRLRGRYPHHDPADLEARAAAEYRRLVTSPVTAYISNLVEHAVRSALPPADGARPADS